MKKINILLLLLMIFAVANTSCNKDYYDDLDDYYCYEEYCFLDYDDYLEYVEEQQPIPLIPDDADDLFWYCFEEQFIDFAKIDGIEKSEDTNLESWILDEKINKNCQMYASFWGPPIYVGSKYDVDKVETGYSAISYPCVIYKTGYYPDTTNESYSITNITITDPEVYVYGLTIKSTEEEVMKTLLDNGFSYIEETYDQNNLKHLIFKKNEVYFEFFRLMIKIYVNTTSYFYKIYY